MEDLKEIKNISSYFVQNFIPDMPNLYEKCYESVYKYKHTDYEFTKEDKINLITLASYWSGLIKKAWRIFVDGMGYQKNSFWDALIQVFVFRQHIFFDNFWETLLKEDKEFQQLIDKTFNPEWIRKMFVGIDVKWLYKKFNDSTLK